MPEQLEQIFPYVSVLGKKTAVQTHLKRMREGLDPVIVQPDSAAKDSDNENEEDNTKRFFHISTNLWRGNFKPN